MPETKDITTIVVVTDSETSYDNIGDIDGGYFPNGFLEKHIKSFGSEGLIVKLASMTSAVIVAQHKINRADSEFGCCDAVKE